MEKQIVFQDRTVGYTLRRSRRARRMRLAVYGDGRVVATIPFRLDETSAERFIREKSRWLFSKIEFFKQFPVQPAVMSRREDYLRHKERAYQLAVERVGYFSAAHDFTFNRISIRSQRTRWGSCSKKGNLNFNYKIALLPQRLADYIIVHELCHLKEFNHSRKFWKLVGGIIPDYSDVRRELKKSGIIRV